MKRLGVIALMVFAAAACGGGSSDTSVKASPTSSTSASASSSISSQPTSSSPAPGPTFRGADPSSEPDPGKDFHPTATMAAPCVTAGGSQTMTVNTNPSATVGYSTHYSDGSNELTNKTYKEGFGYGNSDSKGVFVVTWRVPATAPPGKATTDIIPDARLQGTISVSFIVASPVGGC